MPSLLIVTGPPGAGKSTVSALLAKQFSRSVLVEGDRFFDFLEEGSIEPWLSESQHQNATVTAAAAAAAGRFAVDYDTVYDGVVGPWFLAAFAKATGLTELDYVLLLAAVEICVERVRSRVGHGFTNEEAALKMHQEFATAEVDHRHVLRDSTSPKSVAEDISSARLVGRFSLDIDN